MAQKNHVIKKTSSKTSKNKGKAKSTTATKAKKCGISAKQWFWPLIGMIAILVTVITVTCVIQISESYNWSASKISKAFLEEIPTLEAENINEDSSDSNFEGLVSKTVLYDSRYEKLMDKEEHEWAISIEVYDNNKNAEVRYKDMEWLYNDYFVNTISWVNYRQLLGDTSWDTTKQYRSGNVVFRFISSYTSSEASQILSIFDETLGKYTQTEENIPADEDYVETKHGEYIANVKKALANSVESFADTLLESVSDNSISVTISELEEAKELMEDYSKIEGAEDKCAEVIEAIDTRITTEKTKEEERIRAEAEAAAQKEREEQEQLAAKARVFSAGTYKVGVDIESGTYNLIAQSGHGTISVKGSRLKVNEMMGVSRNYYIPRYNNASLSYGDEIEITSSLVVKFEPVR